MESGDDTVKIGGRVAGQIYTGSGSDTVEIGSTTNYALIDLGSGNTPKGYMSEYQDGSGLSLGSDDNTDKASDHNILKVKDILRGTVIGGIGSEDITAGSVSRGNISTDGGIDNIAITGNVSVAFVDAGADNDTIEIGGGVSDSSHVDGGSGNDKILIKGTVIGDSYILGGSGDDTITIEGTDIAGISVYNSTVHGGSGDDTFNITGIIGGPVPGSALYGGSGDDVLNLGGTIASTSFVDMGTGVDAIVLTGQDQNLGLKEVLNVEYIDLTGTGNNQLTAVWKDYLTRNGSGNEDGILRINGDAGDEVNIGRQGGLGDQFADGDATWSSTGETVTGTGDVIQDAGVTYNVWQLGDSGTQVYIAADITVI